MDYIVRATAANGYVRAFAANTHDMAEKARSIHHTTPVATAALGRLMTAGAMMGVMMKGEEDLLSLTIRSEGPLQGMTVTADSKGNVKGFPYNPNCPLMVNSMNKLDVGGAMGPGMLTVVKDLGLKEPYSSQVDLQSGEIGDDLAYYFTLSEQTPSSVGVGVLVNQDESVQQAGGFIIQLMPGFDDSVVDRLMENLSGVKSVTELLSEGLTPEEILEKLLGNLGLEINDTVPCAFNCNCSRERVRKALLSVGKKELRSMIAENRPAELVCDFCNTKYTFTVKELQELI